MTSLHPARRSAERFDDLAEGRRDPHALDSRTAELLELVGALREVPRAQARPEFVTSLREQLMAAAETELAAAPAARDDVARRLSIEPRTTGRREKRIGVAVGALAIVGASTGMAVASQGAIPGDTLYPIKRVIENTEARVSTSDQGKGEQLLGNASDRLSEVQQLTAGDNVDAGLVADTLRTFTSQAQQGSALLMTDYRDNGHTKSVDEVRAFAADSVSTLAGLEGSVPASAHDALLDAAQAVFAIDSTAEQACPDCTGQGITDIPGVLLADSAVTVPTLPAVPTPSAAPSAGGDGTGGQISGLQPPDHVIQVDPSDFPSLLPTTPGLTQPTPTAQAPTRAPSDSASQQPTKKPSNGTVPSKLPSIITSTGVDLSPVTGAVDDLLNGVLQGVTGTVNGLLNPSATPTSGNDGSNGSGLLGK